MPIDDVPPTAVRTGSDSARLSRRVTTAGPLDRRPTYYLVRFGVLGTLFAGVWAAFFAIGNSWWQFVVAGALAIVFGQIALVSHDLAHRQVLRTRRPSGIAGRITGNLGIGASCGGWTDEHARHHADPVHEDLDPGVAPDILVWSKGRAEASRGLPRFAGRWQAYLFFPLLTPEGMNLHHSGVRAVLRPPMKHRGTEAALLFAHFALYLTAVPTVLSPTKAVVFIAVHQDLWGIYTGAAFAPDHEGTPVPKSDRRPDFLRRQVLTSRNVRGCFVDTALGDLDHQIEHHLFPSMPTPNLRRAQPIVRDYCAEIGAPTTRRA